MKIFPAIDLYDKKAVRLFKGDYNQMTVYSDNPIEFKDDAVHPNPSGYRQMGDALAGTVEMLRHRRTKI